MISNVTCATFGADVSKNLGAHTFISGFYCGSWCSSVALSVFSLRLLFALRVNFCFLILTNVLPSILICDFLLIISCYHQYSVHDYYLSVPYMAVKRSIDYVMHCCVCKSLPNYTTYYYMTSDNVFSYWLTSLVTFFDKMLYSPRVTSREVNITFNHLARRLPPS